MKGDSYPSKHFFGIRIWNHIIIQWRTQSLFGKTGTYINPWRRYQSWRRAVNVSKFVLPDALKMHSLALFVLRFLSKTFPKLLKFKLQDTLLGGWFLKIHIFKKKKNVLVRAVKQSGLKRCSKWYRRNHSKQYKYFRRLMTGSRFVKKWRRKSERLRDLLRKWMKTFF